MPCVPHKDLLSGSRYRTDFVPGGARGKRFQSYLLPSSWWYADFLGLILDVRSVLHVMTACSVIVFHSWKGHSTSVEHRPLECLDRPLRGVHTVISWFRKLPVTVFCLEVIFYGICCLVVGDIEGRIVTFVLQFLKHLFERLDYGFICDVLDWD